MAVCANCARELQPTWKYCIQCGTRVVSETAPALGLDPLPSAIRPSAPPTTPPPVNALAVLAVVLACLASPFAALFGHVALAQIRISGARGRRAALVAAALGYVWLAGAVVVLSVLFLPRG